MATSGLLRGCIRVRELALTHRLDQMQRLRMLEEQEAWTREAGFDRLEIIAQMHARRLHAGSDLEPLYTGFYNPRWPRIPEEYTLEIRVDGELLRLEIVFS